MSIDQEWLDSLDVDLALKEVRDCPDEPWTKRAIAGASVGTEVRTAYEEAAELLSIFDLMAVGLPEAKPQLSQLLGARGNDYQRCLFYSLAGRPPLECIVSLRWLVDALRARVQLARQCIVADLDYTTGPPAYSYDESDGPLGTFPLDYRLSDQWQWVFDATQEAIAQNKRR